MSRPLLASLTILSLVFIYAVFVRAQNNQANFRHLTAKEGFTSATVNTIFKDSQGFIWLGAFDGLYRYDGYNFKAFRHDPSDSATLSNNSIYRIYEDRDGVIWIGTMWSGLNKYNRAKDNFRRYYPNPDTSSSDVNGILSIYQDIAGVLWVSTPTGGLHQYIDSADNFLSYKYDTVDNESLKNFVQCMFEDPKGYFLAGTRNGLFMFDWLGKKYETPDFLENVAEMEYFNRGEKYTNAHDITDKLTDFQNCRYNDICRDDQGIYWFATAIGLLKYDPGPDKLTVYENQPGEPASLSSSALIKIVKDPEDSNGNLWISSYWGLNQFHKETGMNTQYFHDPVNPQSLAYSLIYGMYLDDDGLLWIGNENSGVSVLNLRNAHFEYYQIVSDHQYSEDLLTATSFCKDRYGYTWVGTNKGGLIKYDDNMNLAEHYIFQSSEAYCQNCNHVYSIHETADGLLMVGTLRSLFIYDRINDEFKQCSLISNGLPLKSSRINAIYGDSFGWHWAGTAVIKKGLFFQTPQTNNPLNFYQVTQDPLNHTDIRDFYEDRNGVLWVATNGSGIFLLKPENRNPVTFEKFDKKEAETLLNTLSIHCDQNGALWFGGFHGLTRYNQLDDSLHHYNSKNGLKTDAIYDIVGDGEFLWLSSDKGLIRFNPEASVENRAKIMQLSDGLPFEDIYTYDIYRSEDGMIHIGGRRGSGKGFFRFNPDNIQENHRLPPVVITSFSVNNKSILLDSSITQKKHIVLKHNENYFSFEFAALDYVNPGSNQYSYQLEGIDESWILSGNRNYANYTNIPPGKYTFNVRGSNNDGVWNETGTSISVTILPPFWKTWWAYALYMLFVLVLIYLIVWFYLRRQRLLYNLKIEQIHKEKLQELDRIKSGFFANISHEFRTPLTLILVPIKKILSKIKEDDIHHDLIVVQRNARRLENLINQLLDLSKLESGKLKLKASEDDIVGLVKNHVHLFESLAKEKSIRLQFDADKENILLYFDQDKMVKILVNLLSNAFKYTPENGKIEVSVTQKMSNVEISITDTGPGISPDNILQIFDRFYQADETSNKNREGTGIGLALTKELVELHYGKITVESKEGEGSRFTVLLPLGKGHLKEDETDGEPFDRDHLSNDRQEMMANSYQEHKAAPKPEIMTEDDPRPILLVVEDNPDLREYIHGFLSGSYQVLEAENGKDGLEKAIKHIPDLVLTDVIMPAMDGNELCRYLKTDERTSHIPIIMLTARASMESKIEGLETGADDFITKPFDMEELQARIKNLILQRKKLKEIILRNIGSVGQLAARGVSSMEQQFIKKALEVVGKHISDPDFSVELFAREMSLSRVQLHRKLTALVEQPASDFIRTIRLHRAAILLKENAGTIAEIAYDVGFTNPSYFSECFRKQFGKLPSEYTQ